jgi:hypothetical protein
MKLARCYYQLWRESSFDLDQITKKLKCYSPKSTFAILVVFGNENAVNKHLQAQ